MLRALTVVRRAMACYVPQDFRRVAVTEGFAPPPFPSRRSPVIGIAVARGRAWAEVVPEAEAEAFRRALRERKQTPAMERPALSAYAAVAYRGRFYRIPIPGTREPARFGELEAFWAYLRQQLRVKGGIRRERLGLYLAEYAWRYNRRKFTPSEQLRELLALLRRARGRWREQDFPKLKNRK